MHHQLLGKASHSVRAQGAEISVMTPTVPAHEVESHVHVDAHWVYVVRGVYDTTAIGACGALGHGSLIFNPPGTAHRDCFSSECSLPEARFVSIEFDATVWTDWCDQAALPTHAIAFEVHERTLNARLASAFAAASDSTISVEDTCFDVFDFTASRYREDIRHAPTWLTRARAILDDAAYSGERVSVASIAPKCGVHSVHLARAFRRFYRASPGDYLRQRRLQNALQLLKRSPHSIASIAAEMGYTDQAHFTRRFSISMGITPQSYRKLSRS